MAEFVQDNAGEYSQDEGDTVQRGIHTALPEMDSPEPEQQQEKCQVDSNFRAAHAK
jgi:hypothetical protein